MDSLFCKLLAGLIVSIMVTVQAPAKGNLSSIEISSSEGILGMLTTGTISGKVTHNDGATPIAGATVKALQGTTTVATTTTNGTGDYTLPQLAAGSYTVEASATSFGTKSQSLVTVTEGGTNTVNLKLDAIVSGPISYIYDALGRLVATVGSADTTIYTYDAVGNLLSISRQPANQLSIISVVPNSGSVGQMVTINGTGFSAVASENTVQFNGTTAAITSATNTRIITSVPAVGVTGPIQISVTTSQGTVSTPFTVLPASTEPSVQVSPQYVSVLPGNTLQFFATVTGLGGNQSVVWSVNGFSGGNSDVGIISGTGFYTSPNRPASIFAIRATSVANPAVFGQAQLAVLNPSQAEAIISQSISVFHQPPINSAPVTSLSIRRMPQTESAGLVSRGVSVRRLTATETAAPLATAISVRRLPPTESGAPQSQIVSITTGPIIQAVDPTSVVRGTNVTITITGANLNGATGLSFLTTAGAVDATITASNISVNAEGTQLTATVTVSASAVTGQRVVVVATAASHSLAVDVGTNVLEIVQ